MSDNKQAIRAEVRARRRALTPAEQRLHARQVANRIALRHWFQSARDVAAYLPMDGEIDLRPLIRLCWSCGKRVYLPRLDRRNRMQFAAFSRDTRLVQHRLGMRQPASATEIRPISQLDLVLTPLVAFTRDGRRLGMGGGYYDRALAQAQRQVRVGVAHSVQCVEALPEESWDVRLAWVVTEKGVLRPPNGISRS